MKQEIINIALKEVVSDVFENMYFLFPEPLRQAEEIVSLPKSCFRASVKIQNRSEVLVLCASEQLVTTMAKNFLGTEKLVDETDLIDAFKEAANIISGNLVTRLAFNSNVVPDIPVAERSQDCSELASPAGKNEVIFNIDDEYLKAGFVIPGE